MRETDLQRLRSELHGDDARLRAAAIRFAIAHAEETHSLLPDLYQLSKSQFRPIASDTWAAIRRYGSLAAPYLLELLRNGDSMDRQNAVHLLLELGHNPSSWKVREAILHDRPNSQPDWGRHRDDVLARRGGMATSRSRVAMNAVRRASPVYHVRMIMAIDRHRHNKGANCFHDWWQKNCQALERRGPRPCADVFVLSQPLALFARSPSPMDD